MLLFSLCFLVLSAPYSEQSREFHNQCIENDELNRHVRDMAIAMGLEKVDANDLVQDLVGTLMPPYPPDVEYWKEKGFDLSAFLKRIRSLEGLPFFDKCKISQQNILLWMIPLKDPELSAWVIEFVLDQMKQPVKTEQDARRMRELLIVLGHEGSDKALDILFRVQSKEAWVEDPPVQVELHKESPESHELEIYYLRAAAITGIAYSGTDRALHAFATGEGIADDMGASWESEFDSAAHARVGIYSTLWAYRRGLEPGVEAELEAIYKKYGVEYRLKGYVTDPKIMF